MRNPVAVSIRFLRSFLSKKKEAKKKTKNFAMFFTCVLFSKQFWQQNILDVLLLGFHFPRSPFFFFCCLLFSFRCAECRLFFFFLILSLVSYGSPFFEILPCVCVCVSLHFPFLSDPLVFWFFSFRTPFRFTVSSLDFPLFFCLSSSFTVCYLSCT